MMSPSFFGWQMGPPILSWQFHTSRWWKHRHSGSSWGNHGLYRSGRPWRHGVSQRASSSQNHERFVSFVCPQMVFFAWNMLKREDICFCSSSGVHCPFAGASVFAFRVYSIYKFPGHKQDEGHVLQTSELKKHDRQAACWNLQGTTAKPNKGWNIKKLLGDVPFPWKKSDVQFADKAVWGTPYISPHLQGVRSSVCKSTEQTNSKCEKTLKNGVLLYIYIFPFKTTITLSENPQRNKVLKNPAAFPMSNTIQLQSQRRTSWWPGNQPFPKYPPSGIITYLVFPNRTFEDDLLGNPWKEDKWVGYQIGFC